MNYDPLMRLREKAALVLLAAGISGCGGSGVSPTSSSPTSTPTPAAVLSKPNIVLVVLDDAEEAMVSNMPKLRAAFIDRGLRFNNAFATTPLCGPSRANLLAGQFSHNTGVIANVGNDAGYPGWRSRGYDANNIGPWLKAAGYRTGIFGKYQNDYPTREASEPANETFVPAGWDDWRVVMSDREASNDDYTLNENGALRIYKASNGGYQTDILSERALSFLRAAEANDAQPFFAYIAFNAPHTPTTPASRHLSAYAGSTASRSGSYNESDISDKPRWLQDQSPLLSPGIMSDIDSDYRGSLQALLAVEEAMDSLFSTLDSLGESSNTYVFFTSDNGLHRGEHRLRGGKNTPYEESIRMPFYVRGPGVPSARTVDHLVGLVDLVPTFMTLAGAAIPGSADGMSLVPLLGSAPPATSTWRQDILIEHPGGAGTPIRVPSYYGVRTATEIYVEYDNDEKEYYDLAADPKELTNLSRQASAATLSRLSARVATLKGCRAASCR